MAGIDPKLPFMINRTKDGYGIAKLSFGGPGKLFSDKSGKPESLTPILPKTEYCLNTLWRQLKTFARSVGNSSTSISQ